MNSKIVESLARGSRREAVTLALAASQGKNVERERGESLAGSGDDFDRLVRAHKKRNELEAAGRKGASPADVQRLEHAQAAAAEARKSAIADLDRRVGVAADAARAARLSHQAARKAREDAERVARALKEFEETGEASELSVSIGEGTLGPPNDGWRDLSAPAA